MPSSIVDTLLDTYIQDISTSRFPTGRESFTGSREHLLPVIFQKGYESEVAEQLPSIYESDKKFLLENPKVLNSLIKNMRKEFPGVSDDRLREALLFSSTQTPSSELELGESFSSKAYHNSDEGIPIRGERNVQRWLETARQLYIREKDGENRSNALTAVTAGWSNNEKFDFNNWLRYYESNNHLKYKTAQTKMYGYPGYALPIKSDLYEDTYLASDINDIRNQVDTELTNKQKKEIIEKHRRKIISRLDATEKLLRSDDGHLFAGKELESLIDTIYNLKKKISLVNKLSTSTKLYQDMIIKEANVLVKNGYSDAGEFLYVLAAPAAAAEPAKQESPVLPTATPPAPPAQGSGSAGGLPASIPARPNAPEDPKNENSPASVAGINTSSPPPPPATPELTPSSEPAPGAPPSPPGASTMPTEVISTPFPSEEKATGIKSFLSKLDTMGVTVKDKDKKDEQSADDDLFVLDEDLLDSDELVVEAQVAPVAPVPAAPTAAPIPAAPSAPPVVENEDVILGPEEAEEELEVEEPAVSARTDSVSLQTFDNKINNIFSSISVQDIIFKLENLSKIFKVREIPRQLALVDMMLDSLGLASYFPDLSEATNKALESNNYISTRIDNILSRLHGTLKTKEVNLYGEDISISPEIEMLKNKLEETQNKEKIKKEVRKKQELDEAVQSAKESPEVEIDEDLVPATPVAAPAPAVAPAAPAAPVAPAPVTPAV
jgi:hypothetical protein